MPLLQKEIDKDMLFKLRSPITVYIGKSLIADLPDNHLPEQDPGNLLFLVLIIE